MRKRFAGKQKWMCFFFHLHFTLNGFFLRPLMRYHSIAQIGEKRIGMDRAYFIGFVHTPNEKKKKKIRRSTIKQQKCRDHLSNVEHVTIISLDTNDIAKYVPLFIDKLIIATNLKRNNNKKKAEPQPSLQNVWMNYECIARSIFNQSNS